MCEEFHCLPSAAVRELDAHDAELVFRVMEMRGFARAKDLVDNAKKKTDLKLTPAIARVFEIEEEARKQS